MPAALIYLMFHSQAAASGGCQIFGERLEPSLHLHPEVPLSTSGEGISLVEVTIDDLLGVIALGSLIETLGRGEVADSHHVGIFL